MKDTFLDISFPGGRRSDLNARQKGGLSTGKKAKTNGASTSNVTSKERVNPPVNQTEAPAKTLKALVLIFGASRIIQEDLWRG